MSRFHHGRAFPDNQVTTQAVAVITPAHASAAAQPAPEQTRFGFLFHRLQEQGDSALLTTSDETVKSLTALGEAMDDTPEENALDSRLPAVFTYFGQFIAHDITWEKGTQDITAVSEIRPWRQEQVEAIVNKRSGSLDLDCVYGDGTFEVPRDEANGTLKIGLVAQASCRPPNKDDLNDVPRTSFSQSREQARRALIGDPRNDANTIISQLHVAFLRAHNKLMESNSFADARTKLVQLYQTIVVEDYLNRIIRPDVFSQFREQPDLLHSGNFMPVEFSAAAFRFGHTMIRTSYDLNQNFKGKGSNLSITRLFGVPPGYYHNLPESWIIEWEHFVDGGTNLARQISTQMAEPLSLLPDLPDNPFRDQQSLAVRDLWRGYIFRLPTGQAVAGEIGLEDEIVKPDDFRRLVPSSQWEVLSNSEFLEKTPLWFYILAEAAREKERHPDKDYLGPVGSHLVAGVLMGLLYKSKNSILQNGNSQLGSTLNHLLRWAGVLSDN